MTLVYGQQFFQGIIMMTDSRASKIINGKYIPWSDNVQKIFRISDHIFIAFSGDIEFASLILYFLLREVSKRPILGNLNIFYQKAPKLIRYIYREILKEKNFENDARKVAFMFGGIDFKRPTLVREKDGTYSRLGIFDKKLALFSCPDFELKESQNWQGPFLIMGSGAPALNGNEEGFKNLQFDIRADIPVVNQAFLIQYVLRQKIKELGINTVGGMFQMVTIDNTGSRFHEYKTKSDNDQSDDLDIELIFKGHRMVQRNIKTGVEIPLLYPPEIIRCENLSKNLFSALNR